MTDTAPSASGASGLSRDLQERKRIIHGELTKRTVWFIRLRWWVPPAIVAGVAAGRIIGVDFTVRPLFLVAGFILAYNLGFHLLRERLTAAGPAEQERVTRFTWYQVGFDYLAMFLLIHYTGGTASPLIFFFIFHIIFAAILLPARLAYAFAILAAAGMVVIAGAEYHGLLTHHPLDFHGQTINLAQQPANFMIELFFFGASVLITAYTTTAIMTMLRKRILNLAELSEQISDLNSKFATLYQMSQVLGAAHNLEQVLSIVSSELASVMNVTAISIKLLSPDRKRLTYAAAYGLPPEFTTRRVVEADKSPLNRRIIEGEHYVTGGVTRGEMFQFGEDLTALNLRSVLFVPLKVEDRIIGILGAYCVTPDRFQAQEVDFFRLAGGFVAIALENARNYEALEKMVRERSWFMMKVAHNLRAPLAASLSILEVVLGNYLGEFNERQGSYLRRLEYPIHNMLNMINELMVLYAQRSDKKPAAHGVVDLVALTVRVHQAFTEHADKKNIAFELTAAPDLPKINGNGEMLEQMVENLVSNAIKYTKEGGRVQLCCSCPNPDEICLEVKDNGIGIPKADQPRLFTEFFRADNAKDLERIGTGLGLAIVKEIVTEHHGRMQVESEENQGSRFRISLPALSSAIANV
jgi:signal transduction histidine kinase